MSKSKVKAFTIMEVTITMLIAGLLIGIAYTSYSIVVKSYRSFTTKNDDMAVLVILDHLLSRDFEQAETISKNENGIILTSDNKIVRYEINPAFIIRNAARIDTFKMQTQDVITAFENTPVNELQEATENNQIDELNFTLIFENEKIPCHYKKQYSSVNLMQRNANAIN